MNTQLINGTCVTNKVSHEQSVAVTDTDTTSVSETSEVSVQLNVKSDFLVTGSSLTVGDRQSVTYTPRSSHAVQNTQTVNFQAMVPANSTIQADCIVRQSTFDVPWTAAANVTYQDRPQPVTMTLHGTLAGVATTSLKAQYESPKARNKPAA